MPYYLCGYIEKCYGRPIWQFSIHLKNLTWDGSAQHIINLYYFLCPQKNAPQSLPSSRLFWYFITLIRLLPATGRRSVYGRSYTISAYRPFHHDRLGSRRNRNMWPRLRNVLLVAAGSIGCMFYLSWVQVNSGKMIWFSIPTQLKLKKNYVVIFSW